MQPPPPTAPEYRHDIISGQWVVIASERAQRPIDIKSADEPAPSTDCPFCAGNESMMPPAIETVPATGGNSDEWAVRVVPNRYPAVREIAQPGPMTQDSAPGIGRHELIIESPDHVASLTELPVVDLSVVLRAYARRIASMIGDPEVGYPLLFKNVGAAAGASQPHTHAQLIGTRFVPPNIQRELEHTHNTYQDNSRCAFCDLIEQERQSQVRVFAESDELIAFCPYASRFPFEAWVLPKRHESRFEQLTKAGADNLAAFFHNVLSRLESLLPIPTYNFFVHTAPGDDKYAETFHWHIEITPRIVGLAGFELGGGMFINPVPPEWAAQRYLNISNGIS